MDTDDEELKYTKKMMVSIDGYVVAMDQDDAFEYLNKKRLEHEISLYKKELQEKKLIKELKMILHDGQCKPNWRETINDTIKLLEGE